LKEFIRGKRRQQQIGDCLNLRPIDECSTNDDDGFFDIGLDLTSREMPPNDPMPNSTIGKGTKREGRSKLYTVEGGVREWELD
jgi:hypothetical protein